jgi:8-oxo-dGTP pyrophosphatase MutT (NUDIX family)
MRQPLVLQSGVIPYRVRKGRLEVALVTARGGPGWTIPKGHIEPDLTAPASAAKEALEEAGLIGTLSRRSVGSYSYERNGCLKRVSVFAMRVSRIKSSWPEMHQRRRRWFSVDEAAGRVHSEALRFCLQKFSQTRHQLRAPRT